MRILLLLATVYFSASSIAVASDESPSSPAVHFTIVGSMVDGFFDGPAELFTSGTIRRAAGLYRKGKPDGSWSFWDSGRSRIAVFTFREGVLEGQAKLYFGSFNTPAAAGKLKVGGTMKSGWWDGIIQSWYSDGSSRSERIYEAGKVVRASARDGDGASYSESVAMERAQRDDASDRKLVTLLTAIIREAPDHAQRRTP
jgi:Uncharacterized protein conserved in bacteria